MGWGFIHVMHDDWMYDGSCAAGTNVDAVSQETAVVDPIKEDVMKKSFVPSVSQLDEVIDLSCDEIRCIL